MAQRETNRVIGVLDHAVSDVIGRLQLRAMQTLTSATPVDTGHARSGWTPNVGSPVTDRLDRPSDEGAARSGADSRLTTNLGRAATIAGTYRTLQGPVFISNPVPYINRLNEGWSAQAPARFVERAIDAAIRSIAAVPLGSRFRR